MTENIGMKLAKTSRRLHSVMDCFAGSDCTSQQLKILGFLARHGGSAVQKDIEHCFRLTRPAVSQILDHMQENGLVSREVSADDRRSRLITLTDKGERIAHSTYEKICSFEKNIFSVLSEEEQLQFSQSLDKLCRALEDYSDKASS